MQEPVIQAMVQGRKHCCSRGAHRLFYLMLLGRGLLTWLCGNVFCCGLHQPIDGSRAHCLRAKLVSCEKLQMHLVVLVQSGQAWRLHSMCADLLCGKFVCYLGVDAQL